MLTLPCLEKFVSVTLNGNQIPHGKAARYLGMYLDRSLTWRNKVFVNLKFQIVYWILGRKSELSIENKLLIYKTILKSIWTYGITLWGTGSK
jgi:hypothetical protein